MPHPVDRAAAGHRAGRVTAVAVVLCGAVHTATAVEHWNAATTLAVLTVVTAVACAGCSAALWRDPGDRDWVQAAVGTAVMLGLHLTMIVTMSDTPGGPGGHHDHADGAGPAAVADITSFLGLLLPFGCLALLWWALRHRTGPSTATT